MKQELEQILGIEIKNENLFLEAFTHKSFFNENRKVKRHWNERMEFLGDAVLELLTTDFLFHKYPHKEEGALTAYRSALVKGANLAKISRDLDLGKYLYISKGEEKSGGRNKNYILANTFEALLGAIFLDSGLEICKKLLSQLLFPQIEQVVAEKLHKRPKSTFQELAQEKLAITPHFDLLCENGPDHDKKFEMGAFLEEKLAGKGSGTSKQKGEIAAAADALKKMGWQ